MYYNIYPVNFKATAWEFWNLSIKNVKSLIVSQVDYIKYHRVVCLHLQGIYCYISCHEQCLRLLLMPFLLLWLPFPLHVLRSLGPS